VLNGCNGSLPNRVKQEDRNVTSPVPHNEDKRLAFLRNLRLEISSDFNEIQGLCDVAAQIAGVPIALVTLVDKAQQNFLASVGVGDLKATDREIAFCAHAIMGSDQFEVVDARLDARFVDNPLVVGEPGVQSYLGTVLEPEPEMRLGTLCVVDTQPRQHSATVKASLAKLGQAVSALLISHRQKLNLLDFADQVTQNNIEMAAVTESLQNSMDRILAAESAKSAFLATVTHELRTPLTSIKGALNLLSNNGVVFDTQKSKRLIAIAGKNSDNLLSLVEDMLQLQKADFDEPWVRFAPVDLAALVRASAATHQPFATEKGLALTLSGIDEPCFVNGDKKLLERVIANILSNAFKYTQAGGTVAMALHCLADGPQITVTDDGTGIPEGAEEKVFGMFSQVDSSDTRSHSGAGLGMYISHKILHAHHATISYSSKLGVGTVFTVNFPKFAVEERLCG
jgi:signal transduction histidine kinase